MQTENNASHGTLPKILMGSMVAIGIGLLAGNLISHREIKPDYSGRVVIADLNKDQQALMSTFAENRRLTKVTLGDTREVYLSESDNRIYADTPTEWYRTDGYMNLTESEQWLLQAVADVALPGGLTFEPPMRAYTYNSFLKTLSIFIWFGILFGALFARFDFGTKQTALYRHLAVIPVTGIIGGLMYQEFGLAAMGAFIPSVLLGYLLLTLTTFVEVPALFRIHRSHAANLTSKQKPTKKKGEKTVDLVEIAEKHQEAINKAA